MAYLISRAFAALMSVLFLVSAGLQYNDPDPLVWIALYVAAAVAAGMHAAGRPRPRAALTIAAISLVWAVALVPGFVTKVTAPDLVQEMKASRPEIEEAREAGGLLIVAVSMFVFALVRSRPATSRPEEPLNS